MLQTKADGSGAMTFHSDYYTYGFKTSEIFNFLKNKGIDLTAIGALKKNGWPIEYSLMPGFTKMDAALIMSGTQPDEIGEEWEFWQHPPAEIARKLKLIDAYQLDILAHVPLYKEALEAGAAASTEIGINDLVSHVAWRSWCNKMGIDWPIPEVDPTSSSTPKTDDEMLLRLQDEEAKRIQLTSRVNELETENKVLRRALDAANLENSKLRNETPRTKNEKRFLLIEQLLDDAEAKAIAIGQSFDRRKIQATKRQILASLQKKDRSLFSISSTSFDDIWKLQTLCDLAKGQGATVDAHLFD